MKIANISTTKNNLSKLLDEVRNGESILIVDRDTPIARIEPVENHPDAENRLKTLARGGIVNLPEKNLDVEKFLQRKGGARLGDGESASDALLGERTETR